VLTKGQTRDTAHALYLDTRSNGPQCWRAEVNGESWLRNRDAPAQPRSRELTFGAWTHCR
jgi:hypothetical protein